jgi:hypothetical protein
MTGPLVLYLPTAPAGDLSDNQSSQKYIFGGGNASQPIILNFASIGDAADPLQYCALTIENTSNIILQNLVIKGSPASGICLGGVDGNDVHGV